MRPPLTLHRLVTLRNTLMLIPMVIALSLLGALLWHNADDIRHLAENPQQVTLAQLSAMGGDAAGRWVEIKLDATPRFLRRTTTPTFDQRGRQTGAVTMDYYAIAGNFASTADRMIIVQDQTALPATLVALVAGEDSHAYALARNALQFRQAPLSPILLTTPGLNGTRVMWAVVIAVTAAVVIMLLFTLRGLLNPLHAGPIARLRKSVRAPEGLPALAAEIDREMAGRDPKARRMGVILLPSWLVHRHPFSFSLTSASDVIWVVPRIAVVPRIFRKRWMRNDLSIVSRDGSLRNVTVMESQVPDRLAAIRRWAPWAVIGVDETMMVFGVRMIGSKKKAAIIAMIDRHREEVLAQRTAQPPG